MPSLWFSASDNDPLMPLESSGYATETGFQHMLAENPALLASAIDGSDASQWLLLDRELPIRADLSDVGTWSLDHLFIDSEGRPVLVEVKRSGDPRARREVVAQMLDYAASFATHWSAEALRSRWEHRTAGTGGQEEFDAFLERTGLEDGSELWDQVQTRISAGQLRLLFVADRLSSTLVQIIEFLNDQMSGTEVLGVEIMRHGTDDDDGPTVYQPIVRGQNTPTAAKKSGNRRHDRSDFDTVVLDKLGKNVATAIEELVDGAKALGAFETCGSSSANPALYLNFRTAGGPPVYWPILLRPKTDRVILRMKKLERHPVFEDQSLRQEFLERVAETTGEGVNGNPDGAPWIPLSSLAKPTVVGALVEVLRWVRDTADDA